MSWDAGCQLARSFDVWIHSVRSGEWWDARYLLSNIIYLFSRILKILNYIDIYLI